MSAGGEERAEYDCRWLHIRRVWTDDSSRVSNLRLVCQCYDYHYSNILQSRPMRDSYARRRQPREMGFAPAAFICCLFIRTISKNRCCYHQTWHTKCAAISPGSPSVLGQKVKVMSLKTVPAWVIALLWVLASSRYYFVLATLPDFTFPDFAAVVNSYHTHINFRFDFTSVQFQYYFFRDARLFYVKYNAI